MLKLPGNDGVKMTTIKQQDFAYVWNLKMKQTKENKKTELIETEPFSGRGARSGKRAK